MAILNGEPYRFMLRMAELQEMSEHVRASGMEEICGIVAGLDGSSTAVFPAENSLHRPDRFLMDARQQLKILLEIERRGWQVAAVYHTHPRGIPDPSETDVAEVYDEQAPSIIWGKTPQGWIWKAFLIRAGEIIHLNMIQTNTAVILTDVV